MSKTVTTPEYPHHLAPTTERSKYRYGHRRVQ
jgi:hypothetical protein